MKGSISVKVIIVLVLSFFDVSVSSKLKRLDKRLRTLEEKVQQDSSEFRDNFDLVFENLNGSSAAKAPVQKCTVDGDAVFQNCPAVRGDVNQELSRVREGFAKEKGHLRRSMETFKGEICEIERKLTAGVVKLDDSVKDHYSKCSELVQTIDERRITVHAHLLDKLDGLAKQNQLQNRKLEDIESRLVQENEELREKIRNIKDELINIKESMAKTSKTEAEKDELVKLALHVITAQLEVKRFGSSYYIPRKDKLSWTLAQRQCETLGGYLAVVDSEEEGDYLTDLAKHELRDDNSGVWLGASDLAEEGVWRWAHTQRLLSTGYTKWLEGQPSNYGGNEHCLHLWRARNLKWNDAPCGSEMSYVCELSKYGTS